MDIKNNDDLKIAVLKAIDDSGYKKSFIADKWEYRGKPSVIF